MDTTDRERHTATVSQRWASARNYRQHTTAPTARRRHRARYHALTLGLGALHTLSLLLAATAAAAVGLLFFHQAPDTTSEDTRVVLAIAGALIAMGMTDTLTDLTLSPVATRLRALRAKETDR